MLMGRSFARPERMRMFLKQYVKEMSSLGVNSIGIVLLISFFIGAVICIQMKLNIQSPWMPRWVSGYTTREILLLEFSSSIMCLILAGKVGSNIASELGTMRVTQQIDALEIMGVNSANYLIMPKILALVTIMPFLVIFSSATGILGAYGTAYIGHILPPDDLTLGLQHAFNPWFVWMSIIKSLFFAFIISSVSSFFGYTVEGGSVEVGKGKHRRGGELERAHPLLRRVPHTAAVMRRHCGGLLTGTLRGMTQDNITITEKKKVIEIQHLYKSFDGKEVLKDINAVFDDGKTNLIIGQSGSGKTVLMKCIVGLFRPTSGEVLYDGRDLVTMNKQEWKMLRREMGMIFQSAALFDSMTVLENVMFPLDMFSKDSYAERVKRAQFCLDRVNLLEAQKKFPDEISGGMQKRVAIARAIALNPKYLFCDEPNSGLDPKTSLVIDELIHDITVEFNMTTIINTHDMNSVMGIGENILYIYEGRKEWQGNKDEIMNSTNERLNSFIFASDLFRKVKEANK